MTRWIGIWNDMDGATNAAVVEAATEQEAAVIIAEELQELESDGTVDGVFVAPWDGRAAYRTRTAAQRAELQCCGGEAPNYVDSAPHWATCPQRPEGTGQGHGLNGPEPATAEGRTER